MRIDSIALSTLWAIIVRFLSAFVPVASGKKLQGSRYDDGQWSNEAHQQDSRQACGGCAQISILVCIWRFGGSGGHRTGTMFENAIWQLARWDGDKEIESALLNAQKIYPLRFTVIHRLLMLEKNLYLYICMIKRHEVPRSANAISTQLPFLARQSSMSIRFSVVCAQTRRTLVWFKLYNVKHRLRLGARCSE